MKKLNNKGFVLVETLVVSVFLMTIFSILYNNFYPLIGEYDRREAFDDLDGKYAAYWVKRMIQNDGYNLDISSLMASSYAEFNCDNFNTPTSQETCKTLIKRLQVNKAYIIQYNTSKFKNEVENLHPGSYSNGIKDYVNYLPMFSKSPSANGAGYRVIVEFYRKVYNDTVYDDCVVVDETGACDENLYNGDNINAYSTIEVKK